MYEYKFEEIHTSSMVQISPFGIWERELMELFWLAQIRRHGILCKSTF